MRTFITIALVAGCGAAQPTTSSKPTTGPSNSGGSAAASSTANCASIAKLLLAEHGMKDFAADRQDRARRGGEAIIAATCVDDEWPQPAIDCMASRPSPASCTGQLSEEQQGIYEAHLGEWEMRWKRNDTAMGGQGYGGQGYGGNPCGGGAANPCDGGGPHEPYVACEITDYADFAPVIGEKAKDHDFAIALRKKALSQSCEMHFSNAEKTCFNAAKTAADIAACRGKADDGTKNILDNTLGELDTRLRRVAALEGTPRAIDCKAVAAAHYSDDAWRNHLMSLSATERKRLIDESRGKLVAACTADKWQPVARACVVSAVPREQDLVDCFPDDESKHTQRFGFPAAGVAFKSGVFECDQLAAVVDKIANCDALDKDLREGLRDQFAEQLAMWLDGFGGRKDRLANTCKEMVTSYNDAAKERGCKM
jgi:hypothetical protein